MYKVFGEVILWVLALYGVFSIIRCIAGSVRQKVHKHSQGVKLALVVKNQEETIEGIIRNIYQDEVLNKIMYGKGITVIDMASTDETVKILMRLKKDYEDLDMLNYEEKDAIFTAFDEKGSLPM